MKWDYNFVKVELLNGLCIKRYKKSSAFFRAAVFSVGCHYCFSFEHTTILTLLHNPLSSSTNIMSPANWPGQQQIGHVDMACHEDPDRK